MKNCSKSNKCEINVLSAKQMKISPEIIFFAESVPHKACLRYCLPFSGDYRNKFYFTAFLAFKKCRNKKSLVSAYQIFKHDATHSS